MFSRLTHTASIRANARWFVPVARPTAIERKIAQMSIALPVQNGILQAECTHNSHARTDVSVYKHYHYLYYHRQQSKRHHKAFVFFCLKLNANAIIRPSTKDAAVQKTNSFVVIAATVVSVVVTVVAARVVELSTAYHLTFMYFFRKFVKIRSSVF